MQVDVGVLFTALAVIVIPCITFAVATIVKVAKLEVKVEIYKQISEDSSKSVNTRIADIEEKMDEGFKTIHTDLRKILSQHSKNN